MSAQRLVAGTDRSRMVEYLEYDGKRILEVSLSLPAHLRIEAWRSVRLEQFDPADVAALLAQSPKPLSGETTEP